MLDLGFIGFLVIIWVIHNLVLWARLFFPVGSVAGSEREKESGQLLFPGGMQSSLTELTMSWVQLHHQGYNQLASL